MNEPVAISKTMSSVPVILDFVPTSSSVELNQYPDNSVAPSITMRLRLSGGDNVTTPDGRSLNDIEWSVSIYRGPVSNERIQALDAIGLFNYIPRTEDADYCIAEGCSAWAHLETDAFDLLQTFVMSVRLPSSVRIHAGGGGLCYGWEPDGSGKVWNVTPEANLSTSSSDWVGVKQLEISLGTLEESEDEQPVNGSQRPITVGDLEDLKRSVSATFTNYLVQIRSYLLAILVVSALIAVVVVFR